MAKAGQLHLRSSTADIVREISQKTGLSHSEVTDQLIAWAAAHVTYEMVPKYRIVFPKERRRTKK